MKRLAIALAAVVVGLTTAAPAHAAAPPPEFGNDWDDPRTAAPPVARPNTPNCTVKVVDHKFMDWDVHKFAYTPCAQGPWTTVVLRLEGAVKGRQYDRLGWLTVADVTVFKTSTPEPSVDGIRWSVEKDVTSYASLLNKPQQVGMYLGNTVNETYTGILDVQVYLTFYQGKPPANAPEVLPLDNARNDGTDLVGTVSVPANTERLVAEVHATGSGGGCEEFWYLTAPKSSGYSCNAEPGPYREVQVVIDGKVAGIAMPFPHVYTGGWSNPFLWYVLPAPRAFNIRPLSYDLTPFVGTLTDGKPHDVRVHVLGCVGCVPPGQTGWHVPTNFLAWRDAKAQRVTGGLLAHRLSPLKNNVGYGIVDGQHQVTNDGGHELHAVGYVQTSHGRVTTTVAQTVANTGKHRWTDGENTDGLTATWTDTAAVTSSNGHVSHSRKQYGIDGLVTVDATNRLTTKMTMYDRARDSFVGPSGVRHSVLDDTFRGEAGWILNVPRPDRHGMGWSEHHYRLDGYDKILRQRNGYLY